MSALRQILIFIRRGTLGEALDFYGPKGIGLVPEKVSETTARLLPASGGTTTPILLKEVDGNEAFLANGYSPFLNFEVEDFDFKVPILLSMGGQLDGKIEYTPVGKVASLRSPHGQMLGLFEKNEI